MSQSGYVHLEGCTVVKVIEKAILICIDPDYSTEEIWIPRSQIADHGDNLDEGDVGVTVSITEYIAKQKGIEIE